MEFFVDIADLSEIERIGSVFPLDGFTTNPKIIAKAPSFTAETMAAYKALAQRQSYRVFVQVTGDGAQGMFRQAKALRGYFGECLTVKIPAVPEGFRALRLCREAGIPVLITTVFSVTQALVAAKAGADYVAPYVSSMDNIGGDGVNAVGEMVELFRQNGYACKVLGAGIHTVDQVRRLSLCGCPALTMGPGVYDLLLKHPGTDAALAGFRDIWQASFGNRDVDAFLP